MEHHPIQSARYISTDDYYRAERPSRWPLIFFVNHDTGVGLFKIGVSVFGQVIGQQNIPTFDQPKNPQLFPSLAVAQLVVAYWAIKKFKLRCRPLDLCWVVTTNGTGPTYHRMRDVQL